MQAFVLIEHGCGRNEKAGTSYAAKKVTIGVLSILLMITMNILKDMAVLNIIKTDGKCAPEAKGQLCVKKLNSRTNIKKVSSARGDPWV